MSREHIAKVLKRLREQSGLTANDVGKLIGKSGKTVNAWENNRGQPDAEILMQLCNIYNVDDILAEFKNDSGTQSFNLTEHEKKLVTAYRNKPQMQVCIDKLLDLDNCEIASNIAEDIFDTIKNTKYDFIHVNTEQK